MSSLFFLVCSIFLLIAFIMDEKKKNKLKPQVVVDKENRVLFVINDTKKIIVDKDTKKQLGLINYSVVEIGGKNK
ncbi:hypothetical protein KXQ06_002413 [Staphylococcus pseudintermedius]|nr:hypothetical protein [Staphylococcus pseudintermedius]